MVGRAEAFDVGDGTAARAIMGSELGRTLLPEKKPAMPGCLELKAVCLPFEVLEVVVRCGRCGAGIVVPHNSHRRAVGDSHIKVQAGQDRGASAMLANFPRGVLGRARFTPMCSQVFTQLSRARRLFEGASLGSRQQGGGMLPLSLATLGSGGRYSVLYIVVDDFRADIADAYGQGGRVKTPHLDALGRSSLVFDRSYCQLARCAPSRHSFMTGRYPQTTRVLTSSPTFRGKHPSRCAPPS